MTQREAAVLVKQAGPDTPLCIAYRTDTTGQVAFRTRCEETTHSLPSGPPRSKSSVARSPFAYAGIVVASLLTACAPHSPPVAMDLDEAVDQTFAERHPMKQVVLPEPPTVARGFDEQFAAQARGGYLGGIDAMTPETLAEWDQLEAMDRAKQKDWAVLVADQKAKRAQVELGTPEIVDD